MSARDIDLDLWRGRPYPPARACSRMPSSSCPATRKQPAAESPGRRSSSTIAPDGATVTSLNANENVQVDLPADGDLPAKRIRLRIARRHRCARRGPAERHLYAATSNTARFAPRVATSPAVERIARSTVARRRNQAWSRRGPAGGLPRQRALHGRSAGRRRCDRGRSIMSTAIRSSYRRPRTQVPSRPACQRRASDRRGARHPVDARHAEAQRRHEGPQLHAAAAETCGPDGPVAPLGGRGKPAPAAGRGDRCRGETAANRSRQRGCAVRCSKQDQPVTVTSNRLDLRWRTPATRSTAATRGCGSGRHQFNGDTIIVDDKTGNLEAQHQRAHRDDAGRRRSPRPAQARPDAHDRRRRTRSSTTTRSGWRPTPARRT